MMNNDKKPRATVTFSYDPSAADQRLDEEKRIYAALSLLKLRAMVIATGTAKQVAG